MKYLFVKDITCAVIDEMFKVTKGVQNFHHCYYSDAFVTTSDNGLEDWEIPFIIHTAFYGKLVFPYPGQVQSEHIKLY